MQALTRHFSKPSQVRAVFAELRQWTVENVVLTPTLKVKRRIFEQRYNKEIASLYQNLETARRAAIP